MLKTDKHFYVASSYGSLRDTPKINAEKKQQSESNHLNRKHFILTAAAAVRVLLCTVLHIHISHLLRSQFRAGSKKEYAFTSTEETPKKQKKMQCPSRNVQIHTKPERSNRQNGGSRQHANTYNMDTRRRAKHQQYYAQSHSHLSESRAHAFRAPQSQSKRMRAMNVATA